MHLATGRPAPRLRETCNRSFLQVDAGPANPACTAKRETCPDEYDLWIRADAAEGEGRPRPLRAQAQMAAAGLRDATLQTSKETIAESPHAHHTGSRRAFNRAGPLPPTVRAAAPGLSVSLRNQDVSGAQIGT